VSREKREMLKPYGFHQGDYRDNLKINGKENNKCNFWKNGIRN
jgi:hypothetical protein